MHSGCEEKGKVVKSIVYIVYSILGIQNATSEEFGQGTFVVKKRKELKRPLKIERIVSCNSHLVITKDGICQTIKIL